MPTPTLLPSPRLGAVAFALLCLSSLHAAHAQVRLEARPTEASAPGADARSPIELTSERVDPRIDRQYVTATLEQTWTNQLDSILEGRAVVSLGEGAQVTGFAHWNGEKKIVGVVAEGHRVDGRLHLVDDAHQARGHRWPSGCWPSAGRGAVPARCRE